jgi:hypothetical protein
MLNFAIEPVPIYASVILAGVGGAGISIMNRMPASTPCGEIMPFVFRSVARLVTGAASTVVGFAVLSLGLVNLTSPKVGDLSALLDTATTSENVTPRAIALGFAVVFGYSERALSSLSKGLLDHVSIEKDRKAKAPKA